MINDDQLGDGQDDDEESLNRDNLREMLTGDQEKDVKMLNDDQGDARGQEMLMMSAPSMRNCDINPITHGGSVQNNERCDIGPDRMCRTHKCGTRTIKVTSTKWTKNKKTGLHGNKNIKVTKLICIARNGGQESPRVATPTRNRAFKNNLVGRAISQFEKIEDSRKL